MQAVLVYDFIQSSRMTLADSTLMHAQRIMPKSMGLNPTCLMVAFDRPAPIRKRVNSMPILA